MVLDALEVPIVLAPLAGGPSTPELAAAVSGAGGLGFLGAGYLSADALAEDIAQTRALTTRPFGVNLFAITGSPADPVTYRDYVAALGAEAGDPRFDDDAFEAKVGVLVEDPVAIVSFTFGVPPRAAIERLRAVESEIWITVTNADEAEQAAGAGADVLVVQGAEAGGHRGSFDDAPDQPVIPLLDLLRLVRERTSRPLVAAGGIANADAVDAALSAGASAAAA